jgi:predicted TIM-barrel fold metal-dependent hydrolase
MSLSHLIFSGVFERYPGLQVVSLEHEVAWAGHFLNVIDYTYTQRVPRPDWYRFKDGALPSDFFHRNVFISFQEDALGIQIRSTIGVDNLMWGSDYPHAESTFPRSREILDEILREVPEDERRKLVRDNAARLYRFDINGG